MLGGLDVDASPFSSWEGNIGELLVDVVVDMCINQKLFLSLLLRSSVLVVVDFVYWMGFLVSLCLVQGIFRRLRWRGKGARCCVLFLFFPITYVYSRWFDAISDRLNISYIINGNGTFKNLLPWIGGV